jgi:hypothetical protein
MEPAPAGAFNGIANQIMAKIVDAIADHPEAKFFRVVDSDSEDPKNWELEALAIDLLSDTTSQGLHVMKALNVLPNGDIHDCHMDINLPERICDHVYFVEKDSFRFGYPNSFPGEFIPATAIDCFGIYELFYSRIQPEVGIEVLRRGLMVAKRKHYIAEDLGYIFRDERRFAEAAEMFKIAAEEGPSSSFIYGELAAAYAELGDAENEKKYRELFKRPKQQRQVDNAPFKGVSQPYLADKSRIVRWFRSLFERRRKDEPGWPASNTHKGRSLSAILQDCGQPSKDLVGYYKHRSEQPSEDLPKDAPPGPHRTLVFRRSQGLLYVWLHQQSHSWICFQSFWLPDRWGL